MANLESQFEPMDEEERVIMEAIERGETRPIPRERLEKMRKEITKDSGRLQE